MFLFASPMSLIFTLPKTWPDGCESHDVEEHDSEEEEAAGDAIHHQKWGENKVVNFFLKMKIPGLWCCMRECCPPCSCNIIFGTSHHQPISLFIITANCNRSEAGLIVWPALCVDMAEWSSGPYPPWTNTFISPQLSSIPWSMDFGLHLFQPREEEYYFWFWW